jgi:hypothetical protein
VQAGLVTAILASYLGPVSGYLDQRSQLSEERARLSALVEKRDAVTRELRALDQPAVLEARARTIGMVRPGERLYFVNGLPDERPADPPADDGGGIIDWFSDRL